MPKIIKEANGFLFVGIDPGSQSGGVAVIDSRAEIVLAEPMPKSEVEIWNLFLRIQDHGKKLFAVIERVHAMPQQGISSSFTFGQNYGAMRLALAASGCSYDEVLPKAWMAALSIPTTSTTNHNGVKKKAAEVRAEQKEKLRLKAHQLFPRYDLWSRPKSLGTQRMVCDALLIALYCRSRFNA